MSIELSCSELESIIDSQWHNGMLPHIRFVKGESGYSPDPQEWGTSNSTKTNIYQTSGITQPPITAIALHKLLISLEQDSNLITQYFDRVCYIIEGIEHFHDFLFHYRDPDNEHLITIVHPWESGLDNSPIYDSENQLALGKLDALKIEQQIKKRKDINQVIANFRPDEKDYNVYGKLIGFYKKYHYDQQEIAQYSPFRVQDVLYNILLCISLEALLESYTLLQKYSNKYDHAYIQKNQQRLQLLKAAIQSKLFDPNAKQYFSYSLNQKKLLRETTVHSLIANLYFAKNISEINNYISDYQSPEYLHFVSISNSSGSFNPLKYWRGPVWPIINWFVIEIIKKHSKEYAQQLSKELLELIAQQHDLSNTNQDAKQLLYFNLVFNRFTTPSKNQYKHGWLWDSVFASLGWLAVDQDKPKKNIYTDIYNEKNQLLKQGKDLKKIHKGLEKKYNVSFFHEYYVPITTEEYSQGDAIGSELMTWTAAVYLDLYKSSVLTQL